MRALTVKPREPHSLRVETRPDPAPDRGELPVETIAIGIVDIGSCRDAFAGYTGDIKVVLTFGGHG